MALSRFAADEHCNVEKHVYYIYLFIPLFCVNLYFYLLGYFSIQFLVFILIRTEEVKTNFQSKYKTAHKA